jgi:DNA gyrase/topoisomerase IV subunit A
MDSIIPDLYKQYGEYINAHRQFPLLVDGLRPSERRVLLSAYNIAKNKLVKCAKLDGNVVGNYHPHGSVYGTIVQLVRQGFLIGQGNFGCNYGVEPVGPAAMRYTEAMLHPFIKEMAFKYIDHVPTYINDLQEKEQKYIPTMFPFCLCGTEPIQGIGFGYRTVIPCYKISDLAKRLKWLITKEGNEPVIKPKTDCKILSNTKVLRELLTTGKAKLEVSGIYVENASQCKVTLKSWPPGVRFESFLKKFSKELDSNDIGFTDLSVMSTEIVFEVLKQRNRDLIFRKFVNKLKNYLTGNVSFEIRAVDLDNKSSLHSVDELLLGTYNMFSSVNKIMLQTNKQELEQLLSEYHILEKIRPTLTVVLSQQLNLEDSVSHIHEKTGVSIDNIKKIISKYRISKLLTYKLDSQEVQNKINNIVKNLTNINDFIFEQYDQLFVTKAEE